MTDIPTVISLGFDQSFTATGIALVRYHPVSGPLPLWITEVEPLTQPKLQDALSSVLRLLHGREMTLDVVTVEAGFVSTAEATGELDKPRGGLETARSCGMVEAHVWFHWPDVPVHRLLAIVWRPIILGTGHKSASEAILWGRSLLADPTASEHIAEAVGIATAGAMKHLEREGVKA